MSKKAAIIGGGITGLALAYFLLKKGIRATVFEKDDHPGGLLSTFRAGNTHLEKFYHHFFLQDSAAVRLLEELGIRDRLYRSFPSMGLFCEGRFHPFATPLNLLAFRPISVRERIKFGLFSLRAKTKMDWRPLERILAGEWLTEKLGRNIYDKVWGPMLQAKFGKHAGEVPASWVWARIRARSRTRSRFGMREKLGYLRGGYQVLIDALARRIVEEGGEIILESGTANFPLADFDLTVITTPNAHSVPAIRYLGNVCLLLKLSRPFSRFYWTNIADFRVPFCALIEHTKAFDDPAYKGYKYLYVSSYVDHSDPVWGWSDQEVFARFLEGLQIIKPGFSGTDVAEYFVFREKFAQPLPTLEHSGKIPPFQIADNLYLVSNMQIYPEDRGVNESIKLAWTFAEQQ
jgi:protoporphyrinogen oxidase